MKMDLSFLAVFNIVILVVSAVGYTATNLFDRD